MEKILILGIGNLLQSDDGVGVHAVNYIKNRSAPLPDHIEIEDGGTAGFDLLPLFEGKKRVILIDAMLSSASPGTVQHLSVDAISSGSTDISLHQAGIKEIITTLTMIGFTPLLDIVAVSVKNITTCSLSLSPSVRKAIPKAAELALRLAGVDNYIFDLFMQS
ncbi:MAG: hydrogenase maturation protease [Chitinivibrionales bacterium]|nr:hydrogenase maturation protease [Chitinivibrionales bacterium]